MTKKNELLLARGRVQETKKMSYLIIRNNDTLTEKTVAYNMSYEMEKFLRENFMGQTIEVYLNVRRVGNE
jgi:hypothetical protein